MTELEQAIDRVENLFRTVTGKVAPTSEQPYAPIPPERDPALHVEEQMSRLLQMLGEQPSASPTAWTPPIALWESANEIVVFADVPGVSRDRIEVSLQANALVILGSRPAPHSEERRLRFSERPMGFFRRVLPLGPGLKTAELTAHLREGVLEIVIPRDPSAGVANPRLVPIS